MTKIMKKSKPILSVNNLSDADLIRTLLRKPTDLERQSIWETLYVRHYRYVNFHIHQVLPFIKKVEYGDLLNMIFLRFFQRLMEKDFIEKILPARDAQAYIRVILKNMIKDIRKKMLSKHSHILREITFSEKEWEIISSNTQDEINATREYDHSKMFLNENLLFIRSALSTGLSEKDKKILELRIVNNRSYRNIAQELGEAEFTIRQRYLRALLKARKVITEEAEKYLGKNIWSDDILNEIIRKLKH